MGIPIPGATRAQFEATKTEGGSKPFPFVSKAWTNHTAKVSEVTLQADTSGNGNDQMVIRASNEGHEVRLYVSLDPNKVGPGCTDVQKAIQGNVDRLLKAGKCLGLIAWQGNTPTIEPSLFAQAKGKVISFGISGAVDQYGRPKVNAKGYQTINTSLNGLAPELTPVVAPSGYQAAGRAAAGGPPPPPPSEAEYGGSDIPF
jgi:hypothetical protein